MELGILIDEKLERYMREPNVGGIGNAYSRPYTANHYALPMCQANLKNITPCKSIDETFAGVVMSLVGICLVLVWAVSLYDYNFKHGK